MPRSVEEILKHADELATRFENYEPDPRDEIDPAAVAALRMVDRAQCCCRNHQHGSAQPQRLREGVHA